MWGGRKPFTAKASMKKDASSKVAQNLASATVDNTGIRFGRGHLSASTAMVEPPEGEKLPNAATGASCSVISTELKATSTSMLSVEMDNKQNGPVDVKKANPGWMKRGKKVTWDGEGVKSSVENRRPPDLVDWAVADVYSYFRTAGFEEQARAFQDQEIDGKSLLLMTRNDVLTGLSLKLGPALKIYEYHVKPLQTQHLKNTSP
ncbi:sterile alpha motif domain-containing protein 13 isoform X1 [Lissotriton helveticus]